MRPGGAVAMDFACVSRLCTACTTLPLLDPLYLPPLCGTADVEEALKGLHSALAHIDRKLCSGNLVLNGVVGVGKSTLLRAAAIFGCLLLDVPVVFWDYQRENEFAEIPIPSQLLALLEETVWVNGIPAFPGWDYLRQGWVVRPSLVKLGRARGVCVCADEVNVLYATADPLRSVGTKIMHNLLRLGKTPQTVVFITGSSSFLRDRFFCSSESEWSRDYPNRNHSVFSIVKIQPIRDLVQLKAYVRTRYGVADVDDTVLAHTGGVGRRVHVWLDSKRPPKDSLAGAIALATQTSMGIIFASHILAINGVLLNEHGRLLNLNSIPAVDLPYPLVADQATGLTWALLQQWEDAGIILQREERIELLIPAALESIHAALHRTDTATQTLGLRTVLRGWAHDGSAGGAAEPLVLARFREDLDYQSSNIYLINVSNKALLVDGVKLTFDFLKASRRCLFRFAADKGSDAFMVDWAHDGDEVAATLLQIKLGERGMSLPPGALETQMANKAAGRRVVDHSIAGVVVNFAHAAHALVTALKKICPNLKITRYVLITNKIIDAPARKLMQSISVMEQLNMVPIEVFDRELFDQRFATFVL
eukprot:m.268133 g.268133  ORF g.268133 m.268133 type:complete len:592 (+) comp34470_c0_seq1:183-1958(+)